jgi:TolA-binding protein
MFKKLGLLLLVASIMAPLASQAEDISQVAMSKQTMSKVSTYMDELRASRTGQSVQDIMDEKISNINENIDELSKTQKLSDSELENIRISAIAELSKYDGIEDASVLVEMEIAEMQGIMTSANIMFMFTQENLDWYNRCSSGGMCLMLTIMCTPFAVIGDLILLPYTATVSLATGL